jgi:alkylresorcinol/alkylpyrone synthase
MTALILDPAPMADDLPVVDRARPPLADGGTSGPMEQTVSDPVKIVALSVAAPPHVLEQRDVALAAARMFSQRYDEFDRLSRVFETTGIRTRHSVRPLEWFFEPHDWPDRTAAYLDGASALFVEAARGALEAARLRPQDVDAVVTVSTTGISTPSIEARVADVMGFRPDVERIPVFGLGCAGGISGLSLAARLAAARPGANVLFVTVELCTLAFRRNGFTKADIVATALFGDGAAACVLRTGAEGFAEIEAIGSHTWPRTLDIMGWSVEADGLGVIFDRAIPPFVEANLGPAVEGMLARAGLGFDDVDRFICHPGGVKVVLALEQSLGLADGALDHERAVLADYGNMSAPTVLFVLDRVVAAGMPRRSALLAMGPGFSASCVTLRAGA